MIAGGREGSRDHVEQWRLDTLSLSFSDDIRTKLHLPVHTVSPTHPDTEEGSATAASTFLAVDKRKSIKAKEMSDIVTTEEVVSALPSVTFPL